MARNRLRAVTLAALLVFSVVAIPLSGGLSAGTVAATSSPTTYQATDNVEVWERAGLPLRASTANAHKTITNPALTVNYKPDSTGPVDARKSKTAVYDKGSTIDLSFETVTGADTEDFKNRDAELVVAHIEPNADMELSALSLPSNLDEARDLLTPENANSNASFTVKDAGTIGSDGSLSTSFTANDAGIYVTFLATNSTGKSGSFSADSNGDLSVSGNMTVIGADSVVVQESAASVSPSSSSVVRGNNVDFTINSPSGNDLNHTVIVYREATWTNAQFELVVKNQISSDMSEDDFKLKHSITTVEGVADFDGPVTVMGETFNDERFDGDTSATSLMDFIVEKANNNTDSEFSAIELEATDSTTLYASAVGVADVDGSQTLTIETKSSWATGTYRWVYLGGGRDNTDIYTQTGTISVNQPSSPPPTTSPPPADDDDETPPPTSTPRANVTDGEGEITVETSGAATKITVRNVTRGATVQLQLPTEEVERNLEETGSAVRGMRMNFEEDASFDANVSFSATKPDQNVPDINEGEEDQSFGYINVDHTASDEPIGEITFEFSVKKSKLEERGVEPGDVLLFRFNNGRWTGYDSTVVGETDTAYDFEATVPGLSVFSIGSKNQARATFDVTSAAVSKTTVNIAEDFEVSAVIENTGNYKGTFTAELVVDGTTQKTQEVEVPAGETREVVFSWELVEAGDHEILVSGTEAGTVTVRSQQTTTTTTTTTTPEPTTTTTTTAPPTSPGEPDEPVGTPTIAFAVIVILVLAGGAFLLYRRGYF